MQKAVAVQTDHAWLHTMVLFGVDGFVRPRRHRLNPEDYRADSHRQCAIKVLERHGLGVAIVSWSDATAGSYGEQCWRRGVASTSGICSMSGRPIAKGSEVIVTRYEKGIAYVRGFDEMTREDETISGRERRCIVTGEILPDEKRVRFVVGPDNQIVPDIEETLPGRGIWVKAERAAIEKAVAKGLFARAAKAQVTADADAA